ncbi:dynamin family protein [Hydrogenophaga soli]|nr:dynamin family protein [Burkholderiaceae bacterium]
MSFNQNFDLHSRWRRAFSADLQRLADWLSQRDLLDAAVEEHIDLLRRQVQDDRVMVAFVAEFSRGKSELINALFFAGYGRRIMPASAGRTTMCPTELAYNPELPPCLRLLPINTRLESRALVEWREQTDAWETIALDVKDPDGLAASMARVAEVNRVTPEQAAALGFWLDEGGADRSMVGPDGLVEVPRWRHALINIAHPILKQGLVILDTPGLNAIGAEPELTVSLLPQAHSILFILGADTGVTQSDLRIWREHLAPTHGTEASRLVVLNKIDTLWDELSSPEVVADQIQRQVVSSANILGMDPSRVLAVSAQKGLVAKIQNDPELLAASHLAELEAVLVQGIVGQRRQLLVDAVSDGVTRLVSLANQTTQSRIREVTEQIQELESLRGKNTAVIRHMRARIEQEQKEFEGEGGRIQAVRSVHMKLLRELFKVLGHARFRQEVLKLTEKLREPGLKLGVRKTYEQTFAALADLLTQGRKLGEEISSMLSSAFAQLNTEHGLSLLLPPLPDLDRYLRELGDIEQSHVRFLGVGNALKLAQPEFSERLGRALASRLRVVYESAANDLELWNKTAAAQLDTQLRDRRRSYAKRVDAVKRIQDAAGDLDARIAELLGQVGDLEQQSDELRHMTDAMVETQRGVLTQPLPLTA